MIGRTIVFVTGALTGILGCTAANLIAQEADPIAQEAEFGVIPPGSTPNAILIRATRGGLVAIRDEWGGPVEPDADPAGDWRPVVEIVVERQVVEADVGLQHDNGTRHDHCRVSVGSRTYSYHC